jgi:hypothetical protein
MKIGNGWDVSTGGFRKGTCGEFKTKFIKMIIVYRLSQKIEVFQF